MEYSIFTQAQLVGHSMIALPVIWWVLMFVIQLLHWGYAWIDDSEPHTNIMMRLTMTRVFGFELTGEGNRLFTKWDPNLNYKYQSSGQLAIWLVPIMLALLPLAIYVLVEYYKFVVVMLVFVTVMYSIRRLVRLLKVFNKHIKNMEIHNEDNI